MKASSDDKAIKADAAVKVDGKTVDEFNHTTATSDGAFCAYIPVTDGQKLSIFAGCNIAASEVQIDLIVDGVLRYTHVQGTQKQEVGRFSHTFTAGLFRPDGELFVNDQDLTEGYLTVQNHQSNDDEGIAKESSNTAGCIQLCMYVLAPDNYKRGVQPCKTFDDVSGWMGLDGRVVAGTVDSTHHITLMKSDPQPTSQKLDRLRKQAKAPRAGSRPWATFRFYYRSQDSINQTGFRKAKGSSFSLTNPFGNFTSVNGGKPIKQSSSNSRARSHSQVSSQPTVVIDQPSRAGSTVSDAPGNATIVVDGLQATKVQPQNTAPTALMIKQAEQQVVQVQQPQPKQLSVTPSDQFMQGIHEFAIKADTMADQKGVSTPPVLPPRGGTAPRTPSHEPEVQPNGEVAVEEAITPSPKPSGTAPAPTTPITPAVSPSKRRATMTPDTADKRRKTEIDAMEKKMADMRKAVIAKRNARSAMQKKAQEAEAKRKADLEKMMAELEAQMEEEDEMLQEAESELKETETMAAAASREHSFFEDA